MNEWWLLCCLRSVSPPAKPCTAFAAPAAFCVKFRAQIVLPHVTWLHHHTLQMGLVVLAPATAEVKQIESERERAPHSSRVVNRVGPATPKPPLSTSKSTRIESSEMDSSQGSSYQVNAYSGQLGGGAIPARKMHPISSHAGFGVPAL